MSYGNPLNLAKWPVIAEDEIAAVQSVLQSARINYWTGDQGRAFELELAKRFDISHALIMANGTVALEAALRALGIGAGDDVIVTPRSYFASTGAVLSVGARPVFADVDRCSQNLTAQTIEAALTKNTRAILPVHLAGWPCDMPAIMALAEEKNLSVIEDCAQSHGASWSDIPVGSFGHANAISFCQDKIITSGGEGGAVFTNNRDVSNRLWSLRDSGKAGLTNSDAQTRSGFVYSRSVLGSNLRMTEMQSAIGRLQLTKMDFWLQQRRKNAALYFANLASCSLLRLEAPPTEAQHAYYQFYLYVRTKHLRSGWDRDRIVSELRALGVPAVAGACGEIYREPLVQGLGLSPPRPLAVAQELACSSIALPVYPTLSADQIDRIVDCINRVMAMGRRD